MIILWFFFRKSGPRGIRGWGDGVPEHPPQQPATARHPLSWGQI